MADSHAIWGVLLITLGFALLLVELFVPSGGILSVLAAVSLVAGIVFMFNVSQTAGMVSAICALILLPVVIAFGFKIAPDTPFIKWLTLHDQQRRLVTTGDSAPSAEQAPSLVGATGKAVTDLRPIGKCLLNGKREECLAIGGIIKAGTPIKVVSVDGMHIKVRADEPSKNA